MQSYNTLFVNLKAFPLFPHHFNRWKYRLFQGAIVAVAWCLSPTHRWALLHGTFSPGGALDPMLLKPWFHHGILTTNLAQLVEFTGISGSINSFCITLRCFFTIPVANTFFLIGIPDTKNVNLSWWSLLLETTPKLEGYIAFHLLRDSW